MGLLYSNVATGHSSRKPASIKKAEECLEMAHLITHTSIVVCNQWNSLTWAAHTAHASGKRKAASYRHFQFWFSSRKVNKTQMTYCFQKGKKTVKKGKKKSPFHALCHTENRKYFLPVFFFPPVIGIKKWLPVMCRKAICWVSEMYVLIFFRTEDQSILPAPFLVH